MLRLRQNPDRDEIVDIAPAHISAVKPLYGGRSEVFIGGSRQTTIWVQETPEQIAQMRALWNAWPAMLRAEDQPAHLAPAYCIWDINCARVVSYNFGGETNVG